MDTRQVGGLLVALALLAVPSAVGLELDQSRKAAASDAGPTFDEESDATPQPRGPDVPGVQSSPWADVDRNRVFDTLDQELQGKPGTWQREVVVMLNEEPTEAKVGELKQALGGFILTSDKENPWDAGGKPWTVIPAFAAVLTRDQVEQLAARSDVWQIEPVVQAHAFMNTAKDESGVDKAKTDFGVNGDRTGALKTYTKDDIVICVIDTGIYKAHLDLNEGQVIGWKDYVGGQAAAYDDNGHGTHVSGTAAGQGDANTAYRGVAHGAGLVGVKVLDAGGSGSLTNVVNGINWCKNNKATYGIEVITLSLGVGTCTNGTDSTSNAVNAAVDAGIVVTVAAGNDGPGACTVGDPGAASKVITVGAVSDPDNAACTGYKGNGWYLADFSSRGKTGDGRYKPEIVAPGVCITAPWRTATNAYAVSSGTSMATPFVAGAVALMLDASPGLTPATIKSKVMSTSTDWGPDNQAAEPQSYDYGAGILQAHKAVESACGCGDYSEPSNPNHYFRSEDIAATGKKDDYTLQVTSTARTVSISLIIPSASGTKDFDMRLYSPGGAEIANSLGTTRQETISKAIGAYGTGAYKVRVESYTGSGSYWLDVSAAASSLTLAVDQ